MAPANWFPSRVAYRVFIRSTCATAGICLSALTFSCTCWTIAVTVHLPSYATRIPSPRVPTIKNIYNDLKPPFLGSGQANLMISKDYHPNNRRFQALYDLFLPRNDQHTEKKAPEFDSSLYFNALSTFCHYCH